MNNSVTPRFRQEKFFPPQFFDPKPERKPRHHSYIYNKGTTQQKFSKGQQTSASEKVEVKRKTKEKVVGLLKTIDRDLSEKVQKCGSEFEIKKLDCGTKGKAVISRRPYHSCDFRLCPFCALKRSRRIINKYLPRVESFLKFAGQRVEPVHLVLTQAHRDGETIKQTRKRLLDSFRKLTKRSFWTAKFLGGLYSVEMTIGRDGLNHVHLHIIAFRRCFFDVSILRTEWEKATNGDGLNLRLDRITDLKNGLREILKYVSKPGDVEKFTAKHVREFLELKGQKMIGTFGEFGIFCADFDDEKDATDNSDRDALQVGDVCPCGCGAVVYSERMTYAAMLAEMIADEKRQRKRQNFIEAVARL
jgi:hypothetical protein